MEQSLPRMRGDPPVASCCAAISCASTPHARGSTDTTLISLSYLFVYPACAGIHLLHSNPYLSLTSLPRMRGDPPQLAHHIPAEGWSTPHARGSTV